MSRVWLAAALLSLALTSAIPEHALAQRPVVVLSMEGEWPTELGAEVRADLRTSLRERGLDLIDADEIPSSAVATIRLVAPDLDRPVARIEIDDRVSRKRVERDVPLTRDPVDTWSVVIAAAADELLRAAWLELTMVDAPPPAIEPPPELERAARSSLAPDGPADGSFGVTLSGAVEGYTGGAIVGGADLEGTLFVGDVVGIELGVSVRGLVPPQSALGSVEALLGGGQLGVRVALLPRVGMVRLDVGAQLRGSVIDWRPIAGAGAVAMPGQDALLVLRGGVRAALALPGTLHVGLSVWLGAPLVGAAAVDGNGARLVAFDGAEIGGRLEVSLWP